MLKFYHAPWTRSLSILWLLEELGVPYEMELVDIRAPGGAPEAYRAIQPNKKVPAIVHDRVVVTERAAICIYLADAFPEAGLAPPLGDPRRGPYLTSLVYHDSVFDPAVVARAHGLEYQSNDYSFGTFEDMVHNVERQLEKSPYAVGDRFTAADTQLGTGIAFTMNAVKVLPERPAFIEYLARLEKRAAYQRAMTKDQELAKTVPALQKQAPPGG